MTLIIQDYLEEKRKTNMKYLFKIKGMLFVIVGIIALLFVLILFLNTFNEDKRNYELINTNDIEMLNMSDDFVEIIRTTAEKNADWSNLPLSKRFLNKYKSKYGILGKKVNYTNIDSSSYMSSKDDQIVILYLWNNAKEEEYKIHYIVNENNELEDVEIIDKKLLYDEQGNEIIYKRDMHDIWIGNICQLAIPWRFEWNPFDYVYTTDNYDKKWRDGFIPTYDCKHFEIDEIIDLCNQEKQLVYLDVCYGYYVEEEGLIIEKINDVRKYFKVHYLTNKDDWLDDVEVEEISKEEIDKLLLNVK